MVVRSDGYWTPRYVWSVSAIATALLHVGGIWWVRTQWPRSPDIPPAPIAVIAVPLSEPGISLPSPAPTSVPPSPEPPLTASPSNATPVPATANSSATTSARTENDGASPPPVSTESGSTEPTPPPPTPQTTPQPLPAPENPSSPDLAPPDSSTSTGEGDERPNLFVNLTLEPAPDSGINPDMLPTIHVNWRTRIFFLPNEPCFLQPLDATSRLQVTLQLAVEDGLIVGNSVALWHSSRDRIYDDLIMCLITNSPPTLAPSPEEKGLPNTYKALLRVDRIFEDEL